MSFATIWKEPEILMLSEVSQTWKAKHQMISLYVKPKTLTSRKLRVITVVKGWEGGRREEGTLEG
jgi:hypothetical protein